MARVTTFERTPLRLGPIGIIALIAVVLLGVVFSAWRSIRPGYVGIVFDKASHQVTTGAREPGWAFINPFTEVIQQYGAALIGSVLSGMIRAASTTAIGILPV